MARLCGYYDEVEGDPTCQPHISFNLFLFFLFLLSLPLCKAAHSTIVTCRQSPSRSPAVAGKPLPLRSPFAGKPLPPSLPTTSLDTAATPYELPSSLAAGSRHRPPDPPRKAPWSAASSPAAYSSDAGTQGLVLAGVGWDAGSASPERARRASASPE